MMNGKIYKIINLANNKLYVGQTRKQLKQRLARHVKHAEYNRDTYFCRAIRKHSAANFVIELLEECTIELLNEREKFWISELHSTDPSVGYNMNSGGNMPKDTFKGRPRGKNHWTYGKARSLETKNKISRSRKEKENV